MLSLRRASYRWPARYKCLNNARVSRGVYLCNLCKKEFKRREVQVDHIDPIVPVTGWDDLERWACRLLCGIEGFQVLDKKGCHAAKTKAENAIRRENKKKKLTNNK